MSEKYPWVAYVGPVNFPDGGAAARRILGNAKALVLAGYQVVIVSGQQPDGKGETSEIAPGIYCVSVNERDAEHLPKALRYFRYVLMGARSRAWLSAQPDLPTAVILYSGYSPYVLQFMGWARRRGVALMFDAVEWYTSSNLLRFMASPYLWNTEFAMRFLIPKLDGIVSISRALEHYYLGRNLPVVRLPPLFDPDETRSSIPSVHKSSLLRLVYSGSPGRKDLIDTVIEAVLRCDASSGQVRLEIAGLSEAELRDRPPLRKRGGVIPNCLIAHGRVSHTRSMELIGNADFTVFLRHVNRVSTNGFPTKFVESLARGTPVIANLTSDLAEHLVDGQTGLVCTEPTVASLDKALERALSLDYEARRALREGARREAERSFSYKVHAVSFGRLIDKLHRNADKKKGD